MSTTAPAQRRKAIDEANAPWTPRTLSQHLDHVAQRHADTPFVITDDVTFTYAEIRDWSIRLAAGLVEMGIGPGEHVAVVMANHPEFVALKFAIARIGATSVPINFLLRERALRYVLEQSNAVALVTMDEFRGLDYLAMLDSMIPGWESAGGGQHLRDLRNVVVMESSTSAKSAGSTHRSLSSLDIEPSTETGNELATRAAATTVDHLSDILYTSGTTGSPKGVMITHDMVVRTGYAAAYGRAIEPGHRLVFSLPMYHVFGYVECMLAVTFVGGAIVPQLAFDPAETLAAVDRHRLHEIVCVPTMTWALLDEARAKPYDLSSLEIMYSSGGACPPSMYDEIREVFSPDELAMGYGQTETTAAATCHYPEDSDDAIKRSHGRPRIAGIAGDVSLDGALAVYKATSLVSGEDLDAGERGELCVRGPMVTAGYYNKPDETAAAIDSEGWLRTGDIGAVDADGTVHLIGRVKESYRCGGEMVMPASVENVLVEHPGVAQAHVVGVPHERMGEVGCAFVVAEDDADLAADDLVARCRAELARFEVPAHILFVKAEALPLTVTGRVQKFRLVEMAAERL